MYRTLLAISLLALLAPLTGCNRSLDRVEVGEFIDRADEAARKRYAPQICELRGENFTMKRRFQTLDNSPSEEIEIGRKLFCREAGSFARIRQYKLERKSIDIELAPDRKTAKVIAEYVETLPYYEPGMMPATPDDFREFQIIESRDESVVGIEGGDLVFLSSNVDSVQTEFLLKSQISLPYD
jgi:hypothetical protein